VHQYDLECNLSLDVRRIEENAITRNTRRIKRILNIIRMISDIIIILALVMR